MNNSNTLISTRHASDLVRATLERDGVLRHGLARGLINTRALARYIEVESHEDVTFDAILSAIRRFPIQESEHTLTRTGSMISKLSLKNKISVISVRNENGLQRTILRFSEEVNYAGGETFRVVTSMDWVSVTADSKNCGKLESLLSRSAVLRKLEDLAEIVIETSPEIESSAGVLATIATELAINGVIIRQFTTVGPGRVIILVAEKDATRAYQALEALSKSK